MGIPSEAKNIGKIPASFEVPPAQASTPSSEASDGRGSLPGVDNVIRSNAEFTRSAPAAGHDAAPLSGNMSPDGGLSKWRDNAKGV